MWGRLSTIRSKMKHVGVETKRKALMPFTGIKAKLKEPSMKDFMSRRLEELSEEVPSDKICLFEYVAPTEIRPPDQAYQRRISKLFAYLGDYRRDKWGSKTNGAKQRDFQREHALAELTSLRSEIVDLKTQITNSEKLIAAWIIGAVVMYSKDIIPYIWVLALPLIFSFFGFVRFREFQRNVFDLDCYLREIEHGIRGDTGWVNYFFRTRHMEKFFESRAWFWRGAILFSTMIIVFGLVGFFQIESDKREITIKPRPITVLVQPVQPNDSNR